MEDKSSHICNICNIIFAVSETQIFINHMRKHSIMIRICIWCRKEFKDNDSTENVPIDTAENSFECEHCLLLRRNENESAENNNGREVINNANNCQQECESALNSENKNTVEEKTEEESQESNHTCEICHKVFYCKKEVFLRHVKSHFSERMSTSQKSEFKDVDSPENMSSESEESNACDEHLLSNSDEEREGALNSEGWSSHICIICHMIFEVFDTQVFINHMRGHSVIIRICIWCRREFKDNDSTENVPADNAENSFECDHCLRLKREGKESEQEGNNGSEIKNANNCEQERENPENEKAAGGKTEKEPQDNHVCEICHKSFHCEKVFLGHMRVHFSGKKPICQNCKSEFKDVDLAESASTKADEKSYVCNQCLLNRDENQLTIVEINSEDETQNSNASEQERVSALNSENENCLTLSDSSVGNLSEAENKPFKCYLCGKLFKTKKELERHLPTRENECPLCNKKIYHKLSLKYHIRLHSEKLWSVHGKVEHKCYCGAQFRNRSHLYRHLRSHTGERRYVCDTCGKRFLLASVLKSHERIHAGMRLYQCSICGKSYMHKHHLKYHEKTHTGRDTYKCDICDKTFTKKSSLTRHFRIHTGEKPYTCDFCEKKFTTKSNLGDHLKIHTGERPHKCDVCHKSFTQKHRLKEHARIHSKKKSQKCDICGESFSQEEDLSSHMRTHASGSN